MPDAPNYPLMAAQACSAVYDGPLKVVTALGLNTYDAAYSIVVGDDGVEQWFVFRGTANLMDVLMDADIRLTKGYGGEVHAGFLNEFLDALPFLKDIRKPDLPLYCAGHSLGGALATLAAEEFSAAFVYTFGMPALGWLPWTQPNHRRYVHDLDPVPHVPIGLDHVCPAIHLGGSYWSGLWNHLRYGLHGALVEALLDHRIDEYVRVLT